jgi:hypothetical protein
MRKLVYLFIVFIFSSCAVGSFQDVYSTPKKVDFAGQRCLVNYVSTDLYTLDMDKMNKIILEGMNKKNAETCIHIMDVDMKDVMRSRIPFDVKKKDLVGLRKSGKYDFLINVNTCITSDRARELSSVETELEFRIYTINDGKIFYSHKVFGCADFEENYSDPDNNSSDSDFFYDFIYDLFYFLITEPKTRDSQAQKLVLQSMKKAVKDL